MSKTNQSDQVSAETRPLTPQERKFVWWYATLGNGAEAARRAGYARERARITASELLTKRNIKAAVEEELLAERNRARMTRQRIIRMYEEVLMLDPADFYEVEDGNRIRLKRLDELTPVQRRMIKSITGETARSGASIELKDWDHAADKLREMLKLDHDESGTDSAADDPAVSAALGRVEEDKPESGT